MPLMCSAESIESVTGKVMHSSRPRRGKRTLVSTDALIVVHPKSHNY